MIAALDEYKKRLLQNDPRLDYCLNTSRLIPLSVLKEHHVLQLVGHMLRPSAINFSAGQVRDICELTGYHPFKVQLACYHLYNELAGQSKTAWRTMYESEVNAHPSLRRPWDVPHQVISVLQRGLRKSFGKVRPQNEAEVADKVETILESAGFEMARESPQFQFSVKGYRPDFSFRDEDVALEIKLCDSQARLKRIVEEMSADIPSYRSRFSQILFVVYDSGGYIHDVLGLVTDFEKMSGVKVFVCKH